MPMFLILESLLLCLQFRVQGAVSSIHVLKILSIRHYKFSMFYRFLVV